MSAVTGWASTRAVISGPIPRGSPNATAMRGRPGSLRPDLDVGGPAQVVEIAADGELLAQLVPDSVAHVLVLDLAFGPAVGDLENHKLLAVSRPRHGKYRQDGARAGITHGLRVVLGKFGHRDVPRLPFGRPIMIQPL